ncbi:MAG: Uma2 family endonuclease, partial [Pseudomonadota bacterium]|nr:Uma2 family endonuclease [Pseudomonadota bacterium]
RSIRPVLKEFCGASGSGRESAELDLARLPEFSYSFPIRKGFVAVSTALRRPRMRLPEFLAWEPSQNLRWEFDGCEPIAMTGGTFAHNVIAKNILSALDRRLNGTPCVVLGSDMKLRTGVDTIRYPDAMVVCTPVLPAAIEIAEPVVVFEVLSDGTSMTDRIDKTREYELTPSVERYVMLEQDTIAATVLRRAETAWTITVLRQDETLALPEIGVSVPIGEFYAGLTLGAEPQQDDAGGTNPA